MGEYARFGGEEIKIGVCEEMLYLRASQARLVEPVANSFDPRDPSIRAALLWRFPWPDEDDIAPGHYESERTAALWLPVPKDVEHGRLQFSAPGYCVSLPCPETLDDLQLTFEDEIGLTKTTVHRNGHPGTLRIAAQKWIGPELRTLCTVFECGGCGHAWRCEELDDVRDVLVECERLATGLERCARPDPTRAAWWREVARRIVAGYNGEAV